MLNKYISLNLVNPVLFASACVQAASGLALALNGPDFLSAIHIYNAYLLSVLIAAHITLNWGWVKAFLLSKRP